MKKVILFLTQEALSLYRWSAQGAIPLGFFPHDDFGISDFREWIARHADLSFYILTDLVEEDLQHESVPRLSRKDLHALQLRKLDQHFRGMPYRRAKLQQADRRRGQQVLQLSALTSPELLDRILADLASVKAALVGVYSVALLTQEIMARLKSGSPHLLVMSCNSPGQLRQSYFTSAGLRFSRLASFQPQLSMSQQAEMIAKELIRARQYLSTLRLMGREERLTILALFDSSLAQLRAEILLALGDEAEQVQFSVQTDMADLAARLRLPRGCQSWHDVLVAMLVHYRLPNQYAPPEAIKYHQLNVVGKSLQWLSLAVLLLAAILTVWSYLQIGQLQAGLKLGEQKLRLAQQQQRQYLGLIQQASANKPEQLRVSAELYQSHIAAAPDVELTLRQLSQRLQQLEGISITNIQWRTGIATNALLDKSAEAIPASEMRPWQQQTLLIEGRVTNRAAYRVALNQVNALVVALKSWPSAIVTVRQWPVDLRSDSSIKPAAEQEVRGAAPDFVIEIVLPAPAGQRTEPQS
jgi:hypothetical protein